MEDLKVKTRKRIALFASLVSIYALYGGVFADYIWFTIAHFHIKNYNVAFISFYIFLGYIVYCLVFRNVNGIYLSVMKAVLRLA